MVSHFHLFGVVLARFFFPQFSIVDSKTVHRSARFFFPGFSNLDSKKRCKGVHCVDLDESFPKSIYYLLANFGFDTAENEPDFIINHVVFEC